jgi:hypothetical protein
MIPKTKDITVVDGHITQYPEIFRQAQSWARKVRRQAKANASRDVMKKGKKRPHTYKTGRYAGRTEIFLREGLNYKIREQYLEIDSILFNFPLHGIFKAYGVGNKQPAHGRHEARGTRGYVRRQQSEWIDIPLNTNLNALADDVARYYGDKTTMQVYNALKRKENK